MGVISQGGTLARELLTPTGFYREDGVYALHGFYDGAAGGYKTDPRLDPEKYVRYFTDFHSADATSMLPFLAEDYGAATEALLVAQSAEAHGVLALTLTNASAEQLAGVDFAGTSALATPNLCIPLAKKPVFSIRYKVKVLPTISTAAAQIRFGLQSALLATGSGTDQDTATYRALMGFTGHASTGGHLRYIADDNSTATNTDSGVVVTADDQYRVARIDCSDLTYVKFFSDDVLLNPYPTYTKIDLSGISTQYLQPVAFVTKASNTGVGTLYVDWIEVLCQR